MRMSPQARSLLTLDSGDGDPWGWALGHHFAIADLLFTFGEDIPEAWQFRPGARAYREADLEDSWPDSEWLDLYRSEMVTADELRHVGNVLARYTRLCVLHGLDY